MNLSQNVKIRKVKAYSGAATSAVTSDEVDMLGYDGVVFLTTIAVANAGNYVKAQQDTVTGMGSAADLLGTKIVPTANNEPVWLDIYKPLERFLCLVVTRTSSSACGEIYAIQYCGRIKPEGATVANVVTDTVIGELHVSPIEGTA